MSVFLEGKQLASRFRMAFPKMKKEFERAMSRSLVLLGAGWRLEDALPRTRGGQKRRRRLSTAPSAITSLKTVGTWPSLGASVGHTCLLCHGTYLPSFSRLLFGQGKLANCDFLPAELVLRVHAAECQEISRRESKNGSREFARTPLAGHAPAPWT